MSSIKDTINEDKKAVADRLSATRYYPKRHMAPLPSLTSLAWQNDGQNYVWDRNNNVWRTWALGNPDWTQADGFPTTSWIEYIGETLDKMVPNGIRVDRDCSPANTLWSGSVFVDWNNNLGRGVGHVYYYVSGPAPYKQAIMLMTAERLGDRPDYLGMCCPPDIVPTDFRDSGRNFRDCRVFWDDDRSQLVMSATVGEGYAFFKSTDGVDWTFLSHISGPGPLVECPNIARLPVFDEDGNNTGTTKWVILGAVQGEYAGGTDSGECCAAWIGEWDGTTFTADSVNPVPMDFGPDSYATAAGVDAEGQNYTGFWLGNWAYCLEDMPFSGFQNIQATPRTCWIGTDVNGVQRIFTQPLDTQSDYTQVLDGGVQVMNANDPYNFPLVDTGDVFRVDLELNQVDGVWPEEVVLALRTGNVQETFYSTNIIFNSDGSILFDRSNAGYEYPNSPNTPDEAWSKPYTIPAPVGIGAGTRITLSVLVDTCSVEMFFNDGLASMASLFFPPEGCTGITLATTGNVMARAKVSKVGGAQ